jgi:two-component system CheB/CheR fusion protein
MAFVLVQHLASDGRERTEEDLGMNVRDRIPEQHRVNALATLGRLGRPEILEPYRTQRLNKAGAVVAVSITATALVNETGAVYAFATTERAGGG